MPQHAAAAPSATSILMLFFNLFLAEYFFAPRFLGTGRNLTGILPKGFFKILAKALR